MLIIFKTINWIYNGEEVLKKERPIFCVNTINTKIITCSYMFVLYIIQAYRFFYGGKILYKEQLKGVRF